MSFRRRARSNSATGATCMFKLFELNVLVLQHLPSKVCVSIGDEVLD